MEKKIDFVPSKILIIKLKKLGDVIGTTPITRQIRALFPNAEITFLTEPLGGQVYKNSSQINQLWVLSRKPTNLEYVKLCFKVYKEHFDVVIDLYNHNKTALLTLFSFAKLRLGYAKIGKSPFSYNYTVSLSHEERISTNRIQHQLKLTNMLGTNSIDDITDFEIPEQTKEFGFSFTKKHFGSHKAIAFCVQSERTMAQVPVNLLIGIGNHLIDKGYFLYFVYGPGEKENALDVYNGIIQKENCLIEYDIPTIGQVKAIFENCAMYVGNDGGNKHIAVTANLCTVGLFYGDNPKVWTPNEPVKHRYLQTKDNESVLDDFIKLFKNWDFNKKIFIKTI